VISALANPVGAVNARQSQTEMAPSREAPKSERRAETQPASTPIALNFEAGRNSIVESPDLSVEISPMAQTRLLKSQGETIPLIAATLGLGKKTVNSYFYQLT